MEAKRYLKILLLGAGFYFLLHIISIIAFLVAPEKFYFRAWEYFTDIAYRVEGHPMVWVGEESGDLSRKNLFLYRDSWPTRVTTDEFGFRSASHKTEPYPILLAGDSTIFGSGLSDEATLSWQLSDILGQPVFNGARAHVLDALKHPKIGKVEVLIEGMVENVIEPRWLEGITEDMLAGDTAFTPLADKSESIVSVIGDIPIPRYSLPSIGLNGLKRLFGDLKSLISEESHEPLLFHRHLHRRQDLERTVELIVRRRDIISPRVGRYIFLVIPAKQTVYADDLDPYTRNFIPTLVAALKERGVEAVDLTGVFRRESGRGLYFPFDNHWNATGVAVAAEEIARQVFGKSNDLPDP